MSSPEVVLAAIASRTKRIRLGSAVTVLGSDDPIRVFPRFSTLDAASNGRAEVILGRGSFIESFPLFGFPLDSYEALFEEKLELFAAILTNDGKAPVTWAGASGTVRAPLNAQRIFPPQKIAATIRALALSRFEMKYSMGPLAHDRLLHSIELYGTRVIPRVRELLAHV